MARRLQLCTFHCGSLWLGVDVLEVQEVLRQLEMTSVPLAPPVVRGLINLRGQIVTAIDLRTRLGLPPAEGARPPMNVVVRTDEGAVSLLVDEIGDVLELAEDIIETPPDTLQGKVRDLVRNVCKLPGKLLLTLDIRRAVDLAA